MIEENIIFSKFIYYADISLSEIRNYDDFYENYHEYLEGIIEIEIDKQNLRHIFQNSHVSKIKSNILIRVSKIISDNLNTNIIRYQFGEYK